MLGSILAAQVSPRAKAVNPCPFLSCPTVVLRDLLNLPTRVKMFEMLADFSQLNCAD